MIVIAVSTPVTTSLRGFVFVALMKGFPMSSVNGVFVVLSPTLLFFCKVYEEVLTECVLKYPKKYAYPVTSVPMVACKMKWAFNDGAFHHSGMAIRKTCKLVGIKPTRKEMLKYFRPNTPYLPIAEHMLNPLTHG